METQGEYEVSEGGEDPGVAGAETEVESLSYGETESCMTQLPNGSLDEDVENFVESQYSPRINDSGVNISVLPSGKATQVQEWVNEVKTVFVDINTDEDDMIDAEKAAAALADTIRNGGFIPGAWDGSNDEEQKVPDGSFTALFVKEIHERLPFVLMKFINSHCSITPTTRAKQDLHTKILLLASKEFQTPSGNPTEASVEKRLNGRTLSFATLRETDYFAEMNLLFKMTKKIPKSKMTLAGAVKKFVNNSINAAYDNKTAVLFTAYACIPKVVEKCAEEKQLSLSPDQIAKIGFYLQKAVFEEMVNRCLKFLAIIGFELRSCGNQEVSDQAGAVVLSMSSQESTHSSSQGSDVSVHSQESYGRESPSSPPPPLDPNIVEGAINSPDLRELLRNDLGIDSPPVQRLTPSSSPSNTLSSYNSWNSYGGSLSPPAASLPERSPVMEMEPIDDFELADWEVVALNFNLEDSIIAANQADSNSVGSQDSLGEPARRRPRLN